MKQYSHFGKLFGLFIKLNIPIFYPAILLSGTYLRKMKIYPCLCKNVHNYFIPNISKPERIQMFINRWMNEQILIYSHTGILISNEKEQMTGSYMITWWSSKTDWATGARDKWIYTFDSIDTKFWNRQKYYKAKAEEISLVIAWRRGPRGQGNFVG